MSRPILFQSVCANRVLTKKWKGEEKTQERPALRLVNGRREKESHSSGIRQASSYDNTLRNNGVSAKNKRSREVVRFSSLSLSLSLCFSFFAVPSKVFARAYLTPINCGWFLLQNRKVARAGVCGVNGYWLGIFHACGGLSASGTRARNSRVSYRVRAHTRAYEIYRIEPLPCHNNKFYIATWLIRTARGQVRAIIVNCQRWYTRQIIFRSSGAIYILSFRFFFCRVRATVRVNN